METFEDSCHRSDEYPKNLVSNNTPQYSIHAIESQLDQRAGRMFSDEALSAVDFLELVKAPQPRMTAKMAWSRINSLKLLREHLQTSDGDPNFRCVHAPHSRDRLRISRRMATYLLTYLQIPAQFLEFIFPFGKTHFVQDFHSIAFRNTSRLRLDEAGMNLPRLHRSGRQIELLYSLKSVEMSPEDDKRPWYIRQCSVYHAFDVEYERTTWMTIKGNELAKELAQSSLSRRKQQRPQANEPWPAFQDTLEVHATFCHWSAENWHWYINFLEKSLQKSTRRTLSVSVDQKNLPHEDYGRPTEKMESPGEHIQSNTFFGQLATRVVRNLRSLSSTKSRDFTKPAPELPHIELDEPMVVPEIVEEVFSFDDLQHVQFLEEKAAEVSLVLKANSNVMTRILHAYSDLIETNDIADLPNKNWDGTIKDFVKRMNGIVSDLAVQQARADSLLRLLSERKSLLYGILQYRNMEASRIVAEKSQLTALNMEAMTTEMHELARKTKTETVSMRIITLVTLFFLPGTFISTLMSTPIVTFSKNTTDFSGQNIGVGALKLYVAISLPLVLFTFLAWYGVYWWESRKEEAKSKSEKSMA